MAVKGQHVLLVPAGEDDRGSQVLREGLQPGHVERAGAATLPAHRQCAVATASTGSGTAAQAEPSPYPPLDPPLICRIFP